MKTTPDHVPQSAPASSTTLEVPVLARKKFTHRPRPTPPPEPKQEHATISVVRRPIMATTVRMEVCQTMAVDCLDLSGRTRHPRVVWARRVITRLCRIYTTLSYPEIAELIGRPNHSTVITSDQTLDRLLKLEHGHALRAVPLDLKPNAKPIDVQDLLAAIAANVTRDPIVVVQPAEGLSAAVGGTK